MFRHSKNKIPTKNDDKDLEKKEKDVVEITDDIVTEKPDKKDDVKELLEKNLKWSQIIYEQNRKINNKLLWAAIAGWLRLLIVLIPLTLAIFYLPSLLKNYWDKYGEIFGVVAPADTALTDKNSINSLIDGLQIDSASKEQIKAILR